jgi:hypothetical protein
MLADLWRRLRGEAAARRYARSLPARLQRDYGAGSAYTPAQIRSAAIRAGLPTDYLRFGYAAFLNEAAFLALDGTLSAADYHELRSTLRPFKAAPPPASGFRPSSDWMHAGDDCGSAGGGASGG